MRRAHVLLHTKVKDPCPTLVIEAMACGLPVVHPASGGTVELVGDEAGIGVPHPDTWEQDIPPAPEELAEAVDAECSPSCRGTRPRPAPAPSSASRSSRGSSVTRRSSSSSLRSSRGSARAAWPPGSGRRRRRAGSGRRAFRRPAARACGRRDAARSRACGGRSRRSRRHAGRWRACPRGRSCRTTSSGSYSMRAPESTARTR